MAAVSVIHITRGQPRSNPLPAFAPPKLFIEKLWEHLSCGDTGSLATGAAAGQCCYLMPCHRIHYLLHGCCLNWKSWNSSQRQTHFPASWQRKARRPSLLPREAHHPPLACAPASHGMTSFNVWNPWESNSPSHRGHQLWSLDLSESHKHSWRAKKKKDHS